MDSVLDGMKSRPQLRKNRHTRNSIQFAERIDAMPTPSVLDKKITAFYWRTLKDSSVRIRYISKEVCRIFAFVDTNAVLRMPQLKT